MLLAPIFSVHCSFIETSSLCDTRSFRFMKQASGSKSNNDHEFSASVCHTMDCAKHRTTIIYGGRAQEGLLQDAPVVINVETSFSTGLLASTEAEKSNMNNPKAVSNGQQSEKLELFEPPSFMTLVKPKLVSPKAASSKVQNPQQPDSTLQAAWLPTLTQVVNESQGRKKNEEIIAKVTNWSTSKEHTPLKSLLGEATHSSKPKSPKVEESLVSQKISKVPEKNGSRLRTVKSILGPKSPASQVVKGEASKEWNSSARYPADIKREKSKVKSKPYWIQLVCCTSVGPQRR